MAFFQLEYWGEKAWWNYAIEQPLMSTPPPSAPPAVQEADASSAAEGEAATKATTRIAVGRGPGAADAESRLMALLHALMWRNSKASVLEQLDLPPQSEVTHTLTLSSIERHFYDKIERKTKATAKKALSLLERQSTMRDGT